MSIARLHSQSPYIQFEQRSIEAGLSQSNVMTITQDRRGFIWVGTADGLNQYDGYRFRVWKTGDRGLQSGHIWSLALSARDGLWVGTVGAGLHYFDLAREQFTHIESVHPDDPSPKDVYCLWEDPSGKVWMGTAQDGLMIYDPQTRRIHHFPQAAGKTNRPVYGMLADEQGFVWLATYAGLMRVNLEENSSEDSLRASFTVYSAADYPEIPSNGFRTLSFDQEGRLWVGFWPGGIRLFDPTSESFSEPQYYHDNHPSFSPYVSWLLRDKLDRLWVGSFDRGLSLLDQQGLPIQQFQHKAGARNHLGSNFISVIFEDEAGLIWVGTYAGGLHVYSPYRHKFQHIQQQAQQVNSLSHDLVFSFEASHYISPGAFWITTHGGGVNLYDPASESFRAIRADHPEHLSNDVALAVIEDRQNRLWVGTRTGLDMVQGNKLRAWAQAKAPLPSFRHFRYNHQDSTGLYGSFIWSLLEDRWGNIWVGTRGGLNRYQEQDDSWQRFHHKLRAPNQLLGRSVLCMAEGRDGTLWAGTYQGLNEVRRGRMGAVQEIIQHTAGPDSGAYLPHATINSLTVDFEGRLWVGTGDGLAYKEPNGPFRRVALGPEWKSQIIKGLTTDSSGQVWFSSYDGLGKVSFPEGQEAAPPMIRRYDVQDGLQSNEFSEDAAYCAPDGRLMFGGVNGFSTFYQDLLIDNPFRPPVYITAIHLLNEEIPVGQPNKQGDTLLPQSTARTPQLKLGYQDDVLQLDFAALSFTLPDKNRFQYRLIPFEENWVQAGHRHQATYTNLDPGPYTFEVLGTNHDGIGADTPTRLELIVAPPPWQSWWAYSLYALGILALIGGYVRYRVTKREAELRQEAALEQTRLEAQERVRKRSAQDFHDELGHQLTRISLFTTLAQRVQNEPETLQSYLVKIQQQAQALSEGMRDFIWVLDPEQDAVWDTLVRLKDFGESLFEPTDIRFVVGQINPEWAHIGLQLEARRHLVLLVKEALHNALKYAQAQTVQFEAGLEEGHLRVKVVDDGVGFDTGKKSKGYGLQNMQRRAADMGAHFSLHSKTGEGTTIEVRIPLVSETASP